MYRNKGSSLRTYQRKYRDERKQEKQENLEREKKPVHTELHKKAETRMWNNLDTVGMDRSIWKYQYFKYCWIYAAIA